MPNADKSAVFKALADEHRLRVLEMLCGGEMRACRLLENLSITQPTLWYHMKILTDSGLVWAVREDATVRYGLNAEALEAVRRYLGDLSGDAAIGHRCILAIFCQDGSHEKSTGDGYVLNRTASGRLTRCCSVYCIDYMFNVRLLI